MWKSKISNVSKNVHALTGYRWLEAAKDVVKNLESNAKSGELKSGVTAANDVHENENEEDWKKVGSDLYQSASLFAELQARSVQAGRPTGLSVRKRGATGTLGAKNDSQTICFQGINARFWVAQGEGFCAYYKQDAPDNGYNLYLWSSALNGRPALRVNWVPFFAEQIRYHAPVFTSADDGKTHKIVFVFIEPDTQAEMTLRGGSVLAIREYATVLSESGSDATISERHFRMKSARGIKYQGPLGIARDEAGNIIVVGKAKGDRRAQVLNQGYFAWKFSNETLNLIMPRSIKGDDSGYLFCRWGGSLPTHPEHLVVWATDAGALSLTYIGNYLMFTKSGYVNVYKANKGNVDLRSIYNSAAPQGTDRCLIDTKQCNIDSTSVVLSEDSTVEKINSVVIGDVHCMFYIARVTRTRCVLGVVSFVGGTYCAVKNVAVLDFPTLSLNVRDIGRGRAMVAIAERGRPNIHSYNIDVGKLRQRDKKTLRVFTKNYTVIDEGEFIKAVYKGTVGIVNEGEKYTRSRKPASAVCGQVRNLPVSLRRRIAVETISSGVTADTTNSTMYIAQRPSVPAQFREVSTESSASGTEHAIVIRSTSRRIAGEQDVDLSTHGYGREDSAIVEHNTPRPATFGMPKHISEKKSAGGQAVDAGRASLGLRGIKGEFGEREFSVGYGAQIEGSVGGGGFLAGINRGAPGVYLPTGKKNRVPPLEELRLCNSHDCVYSNYTAGGFNTFDVRVSSFRNESWVNGSEAIEGMQIEHPSNSTNGSAGVHTADHEGEPQGFFEAVPPVLSVAGLVFCALAVVLVTCTFLYIKWKTGGFTLTRDHYDDIHGDIMSRRNAEMHELVSTNRRRNPHAPGVDLDEIEIPTTYVVGRTHTSGL